MRQLDQDQSKSKHAQSTQNTTQAGFTMLELLVVIICAVILIGLVWIFRA